VLFKTTECCGIMIYFWESVATNVLSYVTRDHAVHSPNMTECARKTIRFAHSFVGMAMTFDLTVVQDGIEVMHVSNCALLVNDCTLNTYTSYSAESCSGYLSSLKFAHTASSQTRD